MSESRIYNPEMECMNPEQKKALQGERLRQTVKHVYENVTLYRERIDASGMSDEAKERAEEELKRLSILTPESSETSISVPSSSRMT